MKIKKLLLSLLVASFLSFPMIAQGSCNITGQIVRVYETQTYMYVYVKTSPLATATYYYVATNTELRDAIRTAFAVGARVLIYGNATSCSGANPSYGGYATAIYVNP